MKKLDILIIRSFIGPFIITFFVTLFIFVMQFFWLYMDELLGKGLGAWMIIQLLVYMSSTLVPVALPLSILLASIMTFGSLGENFELVAIKSSGISLVRFIKPLFVLMLFVAGGAFVFNNNVIPIANLKALSLLYDLRHSKPAFNLKEGQFNKDMKKFSIRVGEKDKDGKTIRNILIYDHTSSYGNDKLITAKEGQMLPSPDGNYLVFKLRDGWRYEESIDNKTRKKVQTRMHFSKWDKVFDLSALKLNRTDESLFKNAYQMMNIKQLKEGIDSFERYKKRLPEKLGGFIGPYVTYASIEDYRDTFVNNIAAVDKPAMVYDSSFLEFIPDSLRLSVVQQAIVNVRNTKSYCGVVNSDKVIRNASNVNFLVEWHRKIVLSFACIVLFLIGAPLGAIIRKGGIGMPMVIAIVFFVFYHILTSTGEKLVKSETLPAWAGMWMASVILLPVALLLIYQARNDSKVLSKDWYLRVFRGIKSLFARNNK